MDSASRWVGVGEEEEEEEEARRGGETLLLPLRQWRWSKRRECDGVHGMVDGRRVYTECAVRREGSGKIVELVLLQSVCRKHVAPVDNGILDFRDAGRD